MKWKELKHYIEVMDEQQRNSDVAVYVKELDEYCPLYGVELDFADPETCDVLDPYHPYLVICR